MNLEPKKIELSIINSREIIKGFHGKFVHLNNMSIAYWDVEKGSEIPIHNHVHEQIMQVTEGKFELILDGKPQICEPGTVILIPSFVNHGGKALTDCKITDVFSPVREEYK